MKQKHNMGVQFHEKISRSFVKALTFRVIVVVSDLIVVYFITKTFNLTLSVVLFSNLATFLLYFLHERIWNTIHWGKGKK